MTKKQRKNHKKKRPDVFLFYFVFFFFKYIVHSRGDFKVEDLEIPEKTHCLLPNFAVLKEMHPNLNLFLGSVLVLLKNTWFAGVANGPMTSVERRVPKE